MPAEKALRDTMRAVRDKLCKKTEGGRRLYPGGDDGAPTFPP